jgi:WD40 repeat protein/serine/threonine protein kinase
VWEAVAPGGFRVAFKFVPLEGRAGELESRALEVIRNLRHPNLITIFGAWQTGPWLLIGMELADETLFDQFRKEAGRGGTGLSRRPLLRYFQDTAKVIDYLNKPRHFLSGNKPVGIQHGDIKPQNILLVGESVKVGDFGLVRLLKGRVVRAEGGMTPDYAAPEVFDGQISQWSDQFSLAVTWCLLRGGRLPFKDAAGSRVDPRRQAADLTMLPEEERPVVRRALSPVPRQRWPNCRAFVKAMAACTRPGAPPELPRGAATAAAGDTPAAAPPAGPVPGGEGYSVRERIGRGAFAEVYRGTAPGGIPVVIKKIVQPIDPDEAGRGLQALERMRRLKHPYLLATHAFWVADDRLYVVMELADRTLRDHLRLCAPGTGLPPDELIAYMAQAAQALDYLHGQGVLHGDVKPENILLVQGRAKLGDLGLARNLPGNQVSAAGTPRYMAPEAWRGTINRKSDQYSLALTYGELRLGRPPFPGQGSVMEVMMGHLQGLPDLSPLPDVEQRVLLRALAKDPGQRYDTCAEFVEALSEARGPVQGQRPGAVPAAGVERTATLAPGAGRETPRRTLPPSVWARPAKAGAPSRPRPSSLPASRRRWRGVLAAAAVIALTVAGGMTAWVFKRSPLSLHESGQQVSAVQQGADVTSGTKTDLMPKVKPLPPGMDLPVWGASTMGLLGSAQGQGPLLAAPALTLGEHGMVAALGGPPPVTSPEPTSEPAPPSPPSFPGPSGWLASGLVWVAAGAVAVLLVLVLWKTIRGRPRLARGPTQDLEEPGQAPSQEPVPTREEETLTASVRVPFAVPRRQAAEGPDEEAAGRPGVEWSSLEGHRDAVWGVAISADGRLAASAGMDEIVRVWELPGGQKFRRLAGHKEGVTGVVFSPDGRQVLSGSLDGTLLLWDVKRESSVRRFTGHAGRVFAVAFLPGGGQAVSVGEDRTVRLWDVATGAEVRRFEGHDGWVTAVSVSPDGRSLASAGEDRTVRLWEVTTGEQRRCLRGHTAPVRAVAFAPDGRIASGGEDQVVRIWDAQTGREVNALAGHTDWVRGLAYAPGGLLLASAGDDEVVCLWEPTTGALRGRLEGHLGSVLCVAFSPDGRLLLSGSDDQTLRLWQVPSHGGHTNLP